MDFLVVINSLFLSVVISGFASGQKMAATANGEADNKNGHRGDNSDPYPCKHRERHGNTASVACRFSILTNRYIFYIGCNAGGGGCHDAVCNKTIVSI